MNELKPCPFCGRKVVYRESQDEFIWTISIEHKYDWDTPFIPLFSVCPMEFIKHIVWKKFETEEEIKEDVVNAQKQKFIEDWNRRVEE